MLVYGQVSGTAYAEPTRILSEKQKQAILKKQKQPQYAISALRGSERHFVLRDSVEEAIRVQAVLMADGWLTTINPPPPKLKNGKAAGTSSRGGSKNQFTKRATPSSPTADSAEMQRVPEPVIEVHNKRTEACGDCHLLPCECNYPLFIEPRREAVIGLDGQIYHN